MAEPGPTWLHDSLGLYLLNQGNSIVRFDSYGTNSIQAEDPGSSMSYPPMPPAWGPGKKWEFQVCFYNCMQPVLQQYNKAVRAYNAGSKACAKSGKTIGFWSGFGAGVTAGAAVVISGATAGVAPIVAGLIVVGTGGAASVTAGVPAGVTRHSICMEKYEVALEVAKGDYWDGWTHCCDDCWPSPFD